MGKKGKQFQRTEDGHLILMTPEERKLLITDLTSRIEYGVICLIERVDDFGPIHRNEKLTGFCNEERGYFYFDFCYGLNVDFAEKVKPYLRSLKNMTDDEKDELLTKLVGKRHKHLFKIKKNGEVAEIDDRKAKQWNSIENMHFEYICFTPKSINTYMEFMYSHHFDINGLIKKGLALEAPVDMYKTEE